MKTYFRDYAELLEESKIEKAVSFNTIRRIRERLERIEAARNRVDPATYAEILHGIEGAAKLAEMAISGN